MTSYRPTGARLERPAALVRSKDRLLAYQVVGVSHYEIRGPVAHLARLDLGQNRMTFHALSEPGAPEDCAHYLRHWLLRAAEEAFSEAHLGEPQLY